MSEWVSVCGGVGVWVWITDSELLISWRSLTLNGVAFAENGGDAIAGSQLGSRANGPVQFQPRVRDPGVKASKKLRAESPFQNPLPQRFPLGRAFSPHFLVCIKPRALPWAGMRCPVGAKARPVSAIMLRIAVISQRSQTHENMGRNITKDATLRPLCCTQHRSRAFSPKAIRHHRLFRGIRSSVVSLRTRSAECGRPARGWDRRRGRASAWGMRTRCRPFQIPRTGAD